MFRFSRALYPSLNRLREEGWSRLFVQSCQCQAAPMRRMTACGVEELSNEARRRDANVRLAQASLGFRPVGGMA